MVTAKLAALQFYQLAIPPPTPPEGSYDKIASARGEAIFKGKGKLRAVPRAAAVYRTRLEYAQAFKNRYRRLPVKPFA